jgi:hypothetical protein
MPSLTAVEFGSSNGSDNTEITDEQVYSIHFSQPELIKGPDDMITIKVNEAMDQRIDSDGFVLPCEKRVITFPLGTKIHSVECHHSPPQSTPVETSIEQRKLSPTTSFPSKNMMRKPLDFWYDWKTGGGINDGKHVLFLEIIYHPVQYNSEMKCLLFVDQFDITVQYEIHGDRQKGSDAYDLLIISPASFEKELIPLIDHKSALGFNTRSITLDDIYNDIYFSVDGFDEAEEIKQFLYEAFTQWGIEYVLLVGNINKLPIRQTWMGSGEQTMTPITDLYYADLCFGNGSFCSWDSNNNGFYGEAWHQGNNDMVDLYPDIKIGRLACTTSREVKSVVQKIITYEENAYGSDWANTIILAGGDTHTGFNKYPEGELLNGNVKNVTPGFNHVILKTSDETFTATSLNNAINTGAGYLCYAGHGFEIGLSTHPLNSDEWVDYTWLDLLGFRNK